MSLAVHDRCRAACAGRLSCTCAEFEFSPCTLNFATHTQGSETGLLQSFASGCEGLVANSGMTGSQQHHERDVVDAKAFHSLLGVIYWAVWEVHAIFSCKSRLSPPPGSTVASGFTRSGLVWGVSCDMSLVEGNADSFSCVAPRKVASNSQLRRIHSISAGRQAGRPCTCCNTLPGF